jgi:hypothetical protein
LYLIAKTQQWYAVINRALILDQFKVAHEIELEDPIPGIDVIPEAHGG